MTRVTVELEEKVAERLAAPRRIGGETRREAVSRYLGLEDERAVTTDDEVAFAWVGMGWSDVQGADVDRHLAEGFGR